ncbi:MAG: XdhC family protein [Desulfovibrio sp.]|jgi:xanthine dehydrogenase accessory factor|nr:XdhC family protein [Desulfovibrio sp.]
MPNTYRQLLDNLANGREAVLLTLCRPDGVVKTLREDAGVLGDGEEALRVVEEAEGFTVVERLSPAPRLVILGAGHVAVPLAAMGAMLRFEVVVFDDRPSFANRARFPAAREIVCDYFEEAARRLAFRKSDYVAIVTRGHKHDQDCLRAVLKGDPPRYVGMIGSSRRVRIVREQLLREGFAPEILENLHAPIGLAIGAVTPEEIALSILAEMVRERSGRSSGARRGSDEGAFADAELLQWLASDHQEKAALVTVLSVKGSTPRGAGAKMAVLEDGRIIGSIGGGCAEAEVVMEARRIAAQGGWRRKTVDMTDSAEDDGMVCGGVMDVLIEAEA